MASCSPDPAPSCRNCRWWPIGATRQDNLLRAERVSNTGALQGVIIATGVQQWDVSLVFTNGVEAVQADGLDADPDNDYDDIGSVHVRASGAGGECRSSS